MRAAIYTRVSSQEQIDGYSLDAQKRICEQFATQRGWQIVHIYEEPGRSGRSAMRPAFQQMIQDARGGMFDVILVHKLDRFSRSLLDVLTYLGKLSEYNVSFVSATEQFDFSTPFGKVILAMLAAFAQWYLDNLSNEIKKGKLERYRQGDWNGRLSHGYTTPARLEERLNNLVEQYRSGEIPQSDYERDAELIEDALEQYQHLHNTAALPCPFDAPAVRLAYEAYAQSNMSDRAVADLLTSKGYRINNSAWNEHTVRDLLRNRFYLGEVSYGGGRLKGRKALANRKWREGNHDAIISHNLFDRCQAVRADRSAKHQNLTTYSHQLRHYPLAGILEDSCGITWRGHFKDGKRRYRQRQQRAKIKTCTTMKKKYVLADELENQVELVIRELHVPDEWRKYATEAMGQTTHVIQVNESKITAKLARLRELYIEGDINKSEYDKRKGELERQLERAQPDTKTWDMSDFEEAWTLLQNLGYIWEAATLEERKEIAQQLFARLDLESVEVNGSVRIVRVMPTPVMSALLVTSDGEDRVQARTGVQLIAYSPAA